MYVEGRIKTRKWQDESGNDRYSTEIQVNDFTFLTTKKESQAANTTQAQPQKPTEIKEETAGKAASDDDLPF